MSEREAFMAGYAYAAEAMVRCHDPLLGLVADYVTRLAFPARGGEPAQLALQVHERTLAATGEVARVRLDPAAVETAFALWELERGALR